MFRQGMRPAAAAAALLCASAAWGQIAPAVPDSGRLLQENQPAPSAPRPDSAPALVAPRATSPAAPGGAQVLVRELRIEGLSAIPPQEILAMIPPLAAGGEHLNLAGLRARAAAVEAAVRARGLPFARAYLPPQELADGIARIAVVEGRYGRVTSTGDAAAASQRWLAPLQPGQPITADSLERSVLLLSELPGLQVSSVLRPGQEAGTGDLEVAVAQDRAVHGELGVDNHGNRFAGRNRVRAGLDLASPFTFGDQVSLRAAVTDERTWVGSATYGLPLGTSGLRAQLGVSRTDYELGKEFAALGAHGTADVASAVLSYPLVRSRDLNVRLGGGVQAKWLHDERDAVGASDRRRSWSVPLTLGADLRDERSVTWGSLAWIPGRLNLDAGLSAADLASARTQGRFHRITLDLARLQSLAPAVTLFGRVSAQWANKNLDSSEKIFLGGAYGVRAWPSGEAGGDEGWLAQLEARWRLGEFEPFALYDAGRVRFNRESWVAGAANARRLAGAGLGVRWNHGPWSAEAVWARRSSDSPSASEPTAGRNRLWANVSWRF